VKVSIPMLWTLKPLDTCPYQALNHYHYSVENNRGVRPLLGHTGKAWVTSIMR
jgi:hypothetical protein